MEQVLVVETRNVTPNPENPRLIFHQEELDALQESIAQRGILVPLTVYRDGKKFTILDGERRWRCALKLGFPKVPVIVTPKPDRLTNLMMMFAIHHRRNEWDPLPTALKLRDLEELYAGIHGSAPNEKQLAELASLTRGEVRRYKKLLSLPQSYIDLLLAELGKPRSQQKITVDHVLEATAAATALVKSGVLSDEAEDRFRWAVIDKFKLGVIKSTVDPRLFSRVARAVVRGEIDRRSARKEIARFISNKRYDARELYDSLVGDSETLHSAEQSVQRTITRLEVFADGGVMPSESLLIELKSLQRLIRRVLGG